MGSDADSDLPKGIKLAREKYPRKVFVSGHLLNAEFGGDGEDAENLTILTSKANANHKSFDNPIKDALDTLKKLYELLAKHFVDISKIEYGVRVSVTTSRDKWGPNAPEKYICNELICKADLVDAIDPEDLKNIEEDKLEDKVIMEANRFIRNIKEYIRKANRHGKVSNTR